jgi:uncharacterized protein YciI
MKHYLIEITYRVSVEKLGDHIQNHRNFLQKGYDEGLLLMSGPQVPPLGGLVIGRFSGLNEVHAFFERDPYQQLNLATYRILEFNPVKKQDFLNDWISGE